MLSNTPATQHNTPSLQHNTTQHNSTGEPTPAHLDIPSSPVFINLTNSALTHRALLPLEATGGEEEEEGDERRGEEREGEEGKEGRGREVLGGNENQT